MDRELSETVELGTVTADTAGNTGPGGEPNGKFEQVGLTAD